MQTLNVALIVTRNSEILEAVHVSDDVTFDDPLIAFQYADALKRWVASRPLADDPETWTPPIVEVPVPTDFATFQAAELGRIITPRDAGLGWPDDDPEAIAAKAEHRPYDVGSSEAA